jgi:hypothetical protein
MELQCAGVTISSDNWAMEPIPIHKFQYMSIHFPMLLEWWQETTTPARSSTMVLYTAGVEITKANTGMEPLLAQIHQAQQSVV